MVEPTIKTFPDAAALARNVAIWLIAQANAAPTRFSVALSGGSTPKRMFELLATPEFAAQMPWEKLHLFWGDERFVPPDDPDSNYRMTRLALLDHVPLKPANIHPVPYSADINQSAASYARTLQDHFGSETPGAAHPLFDVAFLGLGEDGHTASLFPGSVALQQRDAWVVPVTDGGVKQPRITLTFPVFAASRNCAFLVEGQHKASILKSVLGGDHRYPSTRITALENLIWFTDEAAFHDPG